MQLLKNRRENDSSNRQISNNDKTNEGEDGVAGSFSQTAAHHINSCGDNDYSMDYFLNQAMAKEQREQHSTSSSFYNAHKLAQYKKSSSVVQTTARTNNNNNNY